MRKFVWKFTRVTNKTSQICQYRVCPPVASMQATQRRRILLMSWGILLHSSCKAAPKAWSVLGRGTLCHTRWPRMYQTCSIGNKSGDPAGQSRWSTLFCCRNCCTILARWGLAGGVEEDTPATDCQTHQDLWGFIGDPSDLPYKFLSFASSATDSNGWIFVCKWNDVIKYINFRFQICLSFLLFHHTYKYP